MIPDSRKLKRGLKDISPLFEGAASEPSMIETGFEKGGFQLVSFFSPDGNASPLVLSEYLVSQLIHQNHSASVLSLRPKDGETYLRKTGLQTMGWDQFLEICGSSGRGLCRAPEIAHTLFLDFDYSNPEYFQKIVPMLDQWILLVSPEMESLSEAYRVMKASAALNSHLEYFLLFDKITADEQASRLFEKYGELVCRRLSIHVSWLGSVQMKPGKSPSARLALEALFLGNSSDMESIEKRAIAEFLLKPAEQRQAR